ncbi:MAG: GrpB family protein [Roseimicrobium sp.]
MNHDASPAHHDLIRLLESQPFSGVAVVRHEGRTLIDYYSKRAHEYERIYHKPERQADLARLGEHLRHALAGRRVIELACGTGYWTAAIADTADSIFATDASKEVLAIARAKQLDPARVSFARADAYHPAAPSSDYNAGLAVFWWSHIPRARLAGFLASFHAVLLPGARVVFADNRFVEGSNTPISRADADGNTYQLRRLDDGSTHEVLKNFPSAEELRRVLAPYAENIEVTTFGYFWCVTYEAKATSSSAVSDVLIGGVEKREIVIVDHDPLWPAKFQKHAAIISRALGSKALAIEHVGSTSVPGLAAKPIIDLDVAVEDSSDEAAYLPAMLAAGYVLRVREPDWHEHRMLRTPELDVHLHVFSRGCVEVARHLAFRNRLRSHVGDRLRYEALKRRLAKEDWSDMNAYARAKSEVVEDILVRASQETR